MQAEWRNTARTILALTDDTGHVVIVEPGHDLWSQASARPDIAPFVIEPVAEPKKCLVVGAGPAGLAAVAGPTHRTASQWRRGCLWWV